MLVATEAQLLATGLPERIINTYRLMYDKKPPRTRSAVAKKIGVQPGTVKLHLARIGRALEDPAFTELPTKGTSGQDFMNQNPDKFGEAIVALSAPGATAAQVARKLGISPSAALKIGKELDAQLMPLNRVVSEVRLEDVTMRFGTLTRDAIDAITPEKLEKANARDLAVIAGIGSQNWQLLRGQPTSRVEVGDKRQMNELVQMMLKEAKRRGVEIDVTPEGAVTAGKSKYRNAHHRRDVLKIESGDPAETLAPA